MGVLRNVTICVRIFFEILAWIVFKVKYWNVEHKPLPPITDNLLLESASSLAEKIRKREVSSAHLVEIFIERIKSVNPTLNAVIETRFQEAIKEGRQVDEYLSKNQHTNEELKNSKPFYGVPVTIKENLKLAGFHVTVGLYSWKDKIANEDCDVVRIMKESGAIILGTTNVPELVMWWETSNTIYGRTNNPYDIRRMVGGSSGGEAAIISAAGSPLGIGSDIAGSVRMPAHFNGIFGHKATTGIISTVGMEPFTCELFDKFRTPGPLCRFACDLRPTLRLLTRHSNLINFDKKISMKNLKIYYMENDGSCITTPVSREVKDALRKTLDYFKTTHNASCEKINLLQFKRSLGIVMSKLSEDPNIPTASEQLTDGKGDLSIEWEMIKMIFVKTHYTFSSLLVGLVRKYWKANRESDQYKNIINDHDTLLQTFKEILTDNAIFLFPPSSTTALFHSETHYKPMNFMYTALFNILGLPATVCPVGLSSSGLPIGVQIVGGLYQDNLCISVAEEIEKAFGGWVCPSEIK